MRQGKNWGYTTEIFRNAMVSAHHLEINNGGYCSEHRHEFKFNMFYVIAGVLEITIWRDAKRKDVTVLGPGQSSAVPPGYYHKFEATGKTDAIEIYQVLLLDPDIDRRAEGGVVK